MWTLHTCLISLLDLSEQTQTSRVYTLSCAITGSIWSISKKPRWCRRRFKLWKALKTSKIYIYIYQVLTTHHDLFENLDYYCSAKVLCYIIVKVHSHISEHKLKLSRRREMLNSCLIKLFKIQKFFFCFFKESCF